MARPFEPQAFGKYFLLDKLAVGGMAEIFLAKPGSVAAVRDGKGYLVIKRILPHFSGNAQFTDMFIDEAKISFLLRHRNIVPLHDLGKIDNQYYLAMEWIAGQDLKNVLKRCEKRGLRLSFEHAAWIVGEALKGLDYAHKKTSPDGRPLGIVHRDVSPQNVLVGYDGSVKITDFGIAKAESKLDSTQIGTLKGKFGYMAPEQVVANGPPLDHRADVFAAGIILWELLTGQRLFTGATEIEILEKVRNARIDPPSAYASDVPRDLERIVFKALAKDRDKRYGTCSEMAEELERFLEAFVPGFGAANMAAVMGELFPEEIEGIRRRWSVEVSVVDAGHVQRGADLEASRPDAKLAPPDAPPSLFDDADDAYDPDKTQEVRTRKPAATRLTPEQLVRDLGDLGLPSDPPPEADTATDKVIRTPVRAVPQPSMPPPPPPTTPEDDARPTAPRHVLRMPDDAPGKRPPDAQVEETITHESRKLRRPTRPRGTARRLLLGVGFGGAIALSVLMLMIVGVLPNPMAPPMVEVVCTVDCVVRIDGNVVLASGRQGKWPVGEGTRVVEASRAGYKTKVWSVEAKRGQVRFLDGMLEPLPDALADVAVTSSPAGAKLWVDAVPQDGVTPATLHLAIGDHTLRLESPGYASQTAVYHAHHPGTSPPLDVAMVPSSASMRVTSVPPGAKVFVGGAPKGITPVTIEKLAPGEPLSVTLVLKGYRTENRDVTPPGGADPFPVDVALQEGGGAAPAPSASAAATAAPDSAQPAPSGVSLAPGEGLLTIEVLGGWGEVWVDGVRLSTQSPLTAARLGAGTRTVRVVNPTSGKEAIVKVEVVAGKLTTKKVPLE